MTKVRSHTTLRAEGSRVARHRPSSFHNRPRFRERADFVMKFKRLRNLSGASQQRNHAASGHFILLYRLSSFRGGRRNRDASIDRLQPITEPDDHKIDSTPFLYCRTSLFRGDERR
jgi:hypothetical protein